MDGVEILVHNLSHSDLILQLNDCAQTCAESIIARPKFSSFKPISKALYGHIVQQKVIDSTTAGSSSSSSSPSLSVQIEFRQQYSQKTRSYIDGSKVPVGYNLKNSPVLLNDRSLLRFRNEDDSLLCRKVNTATTTTATATAADSTSANCVSTVRESSTNPNPDACVMNAVYFPLLAALLPKWLKNIALDESRKDFQKVIVLVTGRGQPMSDTAKVSDNSTQYTAKLMQLFLNERYPEVKVQLLHSKTNLFRYDENIGFVKHELLPAIDEYRDQLVERVGGKWKDRMSVTLSFADGASARTNAINASLRYYKPQYMHFWQLKSFWRENKICEDDIEFHSFEDISVEPAMALQYAPNTDGSLRFSSIDCVQDPHVQLVVREMESFRLDFNNTILRAEQKDASFENDLDTFWLRKSKKPVLSVLLVQKGRDGEPKLYRGTNMEVSMPTGSLCAERNVIGSALADDITLRRQDIRYVAVYSASMNVDDIKAEMQQQQQQQGNNATVGNVRTHMRSSSNGSTISNASAGSYLSSPSTSSKAVSMRRRTTSQNSSDGGGSRHYINSNIGDAVPLPESALLPPPAISSASSAQTLSSTSTVPLQQHGTGTGTPPVAAVSAATSSSTRKESTEQVLTDDSSDSDTEGTVDADTGLPAVHSQSSIVGTRGGSQSPPTLQHQYISSSNTAVAAAGNNDNVCDTQQSPPSTNASGAGKRRKLLHTHSFRGAAQITQSLLAMAATVGTAGMDSPTTALNTGSSALLPGVHNMTAATAVAAEASEAAGEAATPEAKFTPAAHSSSNGGDGDVGSSGGLKKSRSAVFLPQKSEPQQQQQQQQHLSGMKKRKIAFNALPFNDNIPDQQIQFDCESSAAGNNINRSFSSPVLSSMQQPLKSSITQPFSSSYTNSGSSSSSSSMASAIDTDLSATAVDMTDGLHTLLPLRQQPFCSTATTSTSAVAAFKHPHISSSSSSSSTMMPPPQPLPPVHHMMHRSHTPQVDIREISVKENDMNPLKPCGACNEWLKKIAEVNPRLKVITFTDSACQGIYIEQVGLD